MKSSRSLQPASKTAHSKKNKDRRSRALVLKYRFEVARLKSASHGLRKNNRHYRDLLHEALINQSQTQRMSRLLFLQQEEDRKAISRELHDEVAQILTAINYELTILSKEAAKSTKGLQGKIVQAQKLVEESVESIHRFARELRPMILDHLGLTAALKSYIKDFVRQTKIPVTLRGSTDAVALNDFSKTVLFRAAQESLTNIGKHSKATRASISIKRIRNMIQMEIRDNGKSFKAPSTRRVVGIKRMGLLGMRERIKMTQGTLVILSSPGKGTLVRVRIPLKGRLGPLVDRRRS